MKTIPYNPNPSLGTLTKSSMPNKNKSIPDDFSNVGTAKELYEKILQYRSGLTNPDRDRDDAYLASYAEMLMREEDFQRSTPQEQVQRLMAAGMSRAAALQALQDQNYGSATPQIAGNVESNATQRMQAINDIVNSAVSIAAQLTDIVSAGVAIGANLQSIQHTMEATKAMKLDNQVNTQYVQAQQYVAKYLQAFDNYAVNNDNVLPDSLAETLNVVKNSPFASQIGDWDNAMQNPFFYSAMRKAYKERAKDAQELYNELRRDTASADILEYGIDKAFEEVREYVLNNDFLDATFENREYYQELQTKDLENNVAVGSQDAMFWTENGGNKRREYLTALTEKEKLSVKLAGLEIDVKEFDAYECREMLDNLKQAKALGEDYFQAKVAEMINQETNRNNLLILAKAASSRAVAREGLAGGLESMGLRMPAGMLRVFNWFQTHGIIDKAVETAIGVGAKVATK